MPASIHILLRQYNCLYCEEGGKQYRRGQKEENAREGNRTETSELGQIYHGSFTDIQLDVYTEIKGNPNSHVRSQLFEI